MPAREVYSGKWTRQTFILMSYAYYKFSGNKAWLSSHYGLLKQFATYLKKFSLIPAAQLSTDDFAGTLTNQMNLAIKGIVGLQAMAAVARVVGHPDDAAQFADLARSMETASPLHFTGYLQPCFPVNV